MLFDACGGRLALLVERGDEALVAEIYRDANAARARATELRAALVALGHVLKRSDSRRLLSGLLSD